LKYPWYIWIPRTLIILLALFMALFSLDVFEMQASLEQKLLALLMHNIPSLLLLLTLLITWRRPLLGAIFFFLLTLLITFFFQTYNEWFTFLAFSVPPLAASILFLLAYLKAEEIDPLPEKHAVIDQ
jgi:hypothetical protein